MKNSKKENRVLIFSAPSGSGKSTIVKHLIGKYKNLDFSISATSRAPRGTEQNGKEYYFLTTDQFRQYINEDKSLNTKRFTTGYSTAPCAVRWRGSGMRRGLYCLISM